MFTKLKIFYNLKLLDYLSQEVLNNPLIKKIIFSKHQYINV
jgi:hypothetical protein